MMLKFGQKHILTNSAAALMFIIKIIKYIDNANEETIRAAIRDARKADNVIFYFTRDNKYLLLAKALERETGRLLKGQINKLPDIYYIHKNGLLNLLWENKKETK